MNFKIDGLFSQLNQHVTSFFVIDLRILYIGFYVYIFFLQDNKELFGDIIVNQDGFIYIAGNAKQMPDQVQDAFKEAIFSLDESDRKGAEKFVKSMLEEKRLLMETWS